MRKRISVADPREALQPYLDGRLAVIAIDADDQDEPEGFLSARAELGAPPVPALRLEPMAKILVVDDQPELAELIQAVLEAAGHAVEAVQGGQAALDRLGQTVYDLVVCDLQMPDVDGAAVHRAIEQLAPPRPAVLFMTGYGGAPAYEDFLRTTSAVVLSKPVGIDELHERVRRLLAER